MGRLYEKEMVGDKTIGYFSNGSVTRGQGIMSDTSTVVKYSSGHIYGNWMGSSLSNQVAYCDEYGNLYKGNGGGSVLAKLENGIVYDAPGYGRKEIARYEGDMYGAAAAVAALMLGLANESGESSVQNETSQSTSNETGGGSASSDDFDFLKFIIAVLLFIPMLVISIIKFVLTSPKAGVLLTVFWTLFPWIMTVVSLLNGTSSIIMWNRAIWFILVSVVTVPISIYLLKCHKKRTINGNNAIASFFLNTPWVFHSFWYVLGIINESNKNSERSYILTQINSLFMRLSKLLKIQIFTAEEQIRLDVSGGVYSNESWVQILISIKIQHCIMLFALIGSIIALFITLRAVKKHKGNPNT